MTAVVALAMAEPKNKGSDQLSPRIHQTLRTVFETAQRIPSPRRTDASEEALENIKMITISFRDGTIREQPLDFLRNGNLIWKTLSRKDFFWVRRNGERIQSVKPKILFGRFTPHEINQSRS
jgi:hypothetical protein